jgi:hypothetical protein
MNYFSLGDFNIFSLSLIWPTRMHVIVDHCVSPDWISLNFIVLQIDGFFFFVKFAKCLAFMYWNTHFLPRFFPLSFACVTLIHLMVFHKPLCVFIFFILSLFVLQPGWSRNNKLHFAVFVLLTHTCSGAISCILF